MTPEDDEKAARPLADEIAVVTSAEYEELLALRVRVAVLEREVLALTGPVTPEMLSRLSDVQGYVRCGEPIQSADLREAVAALRHVRALLPYLPGSMYAVGRDLADGVLAKYPEGKR